MGKQQVAGALAFYHYSDCCNAKIIIYFGQRRVILKILAIFWRGCFETRVKKNHSEFQPCVWLAKSTAGIETVFHVFLGNKRKNYMAFVHLLKSTSMQKKSDFDFLSLSALWSIFACS